MDVRSVVVFFVLASCAAASGATKCWDTARTQRELNACAAHEELEARAELDASYSGVVCHLNTTERHRLEMSQSAWKKFRDQDCEFWGGEGSISEMNELTCKATLDAQRAKELDGWPPNAPRDALAPCGGTAGHE